MRRIFYATETYIMHFLEAAWFLNAPVLAGCKVNFTLRPGVGVWALKQPLCSHLHKITNEPDFYMALAPYAFDEGLCSSCLRAKKSLDFHGPTLPKARIMSLPRIKIIEARAI